MPSSLQRLFIRLPFLGALFLAIAAPGPKMMEGKGAAAATYSEGLPIWIYLVGGAAVLLATAFVLNKKKAGA